MKDLAQRRQFVALAGGSSQVRRGQWEDGVLIGWLEAPRRPSMLMASFEFFKHFTSDVGTSVTASGDEEPTDRFIPKGGKLASLG